MARRHPGDFPWPAAISEGLAETGLSRQDVELVRSLVNGIYVMDDGHLLVGIIETVGDDPSTFDVFDPDGLFLGSIDLGFTIPSRNQPALAGDTLIAVTPGLLDVPFLRARHDTAAVGGNWPVSRKEGRIPSGLRRPGGRRSSPLAVQLSGSRWESVLRRRRSST